MNFDQLPLGRQLQRAVAQAGYQRPTPIQQKAIPPVLEGRDLLGCAQTGTGKTAAFALPILHLLAGRQPARKNVRALVLTPTRELALQIGESFLTYGKYLPLTSSVVFGGVGQAPQVAALKKGVDILVACPGRLNDLIAQGHVDLSGLEIFVLDEADRMLDMGFVHDVKKVIAKLPAKRQNLMFSATMPPEIEQLAASFLKDPAFVKVDPVSSTVDKIEQSLYFVSKGDKRRLLPHLLQDTSITSALVFSRTKHGADRIARDLTRAGIPAAAIHGNKSQNARVAALEGFKNGKTRVLVATDIAARGIDISELSHVFNFDLPEVPETYVHRIGRTARAGQSGCAVSFCSPEEKEYLAGIEKLNRKKIPVVENHPWAENADQPAPPRQPLPAKAQPKKKEKPESRPAPEKEARPQQKGKEGTTVEEKKEFHKEEKKETLSASAKRRRRRHRSNAAREAAAQNGALPNRGEQAPKGQKQRPAKPDRQEKPVRQPQAAPAKEEHAAPQPVRQEKQARPAAPQPQPKKQERPAPPLRQQPVKPAKPAEEDPGLLLISRRPPAQKFASFEEYMKSHGGFSAVEEGDQE